VNPRGAITAEHVFRLAQGRPSRETIRLLTRHAEQDLEAATVEHAEVNDTDGVSALPGAEALLAVHRGKPDPACYLLAARRLNTDAARCVVLEDAPAVIHAGRAAGATVIALRTTHSDDELREAHAIVENLASLTTTPNTPTPTKVQTPT
jgi:phosphoglycolate phosphatase-like HAD superfamily hydrolase